MSFFLRTFSTFNLILLPMKCTFAYLLLCYALTQYCYGQRLGLEASLNPSSAQEQASLSVAWTEDESARTTTTSTWLSDDGQIKIRQSSRPIHYTNSLGKLVPIDPTLRPQHDGTWAAEDQPYPTHLLADGRLQVALSQTHSFNLGGNLKVNGTTVQMQHRVEGNIVTYELDYSGLGKRAEFRENGVKYSFFLSAPPAISGNLVLSESLELPAGYTVEEDRSNGDQTALGWAGDLWVKNERGERVATLFAPLCFDNDGAYTLASYHIEKKAATTNVEIRLEESWLNAPARSYPITIDPLVTGPLAAWTGGTMPSCFSPSYNQDSILVTIPGGTSVTELNVTASFYADPFTPAIMADGRMFFSTDCGNTTTFSIVGTPGNSPGTAYLDYYDLHNPLTCCFPESCVDQNFYLSFHISRVVNGAGCNTTYIRYDPVTTSWPFEAVIVGRTAESFGGQWSVPIAPICTNTCTISGTAYAYYGVPPYTFTHPWSTDTFVTGVNNGCATGATNQVFQLTIPNCPSYCDENFTSLDVPPATIVDACGNVVSGLPTKTVPIKVAPQVNAVADQDLCSGSELDIALVPCVAGATIQWSGNGDSGNSNIVDTVLNTGITTDTLTYLASASLNGCESDTLSVFVRVHPLPKVAFSNQPDPIISGLPANFEDQTNFNGELGTLWQWTMGDGDAYLMQNPDHVYGAPGEYTVCLGAFDSQGCFDSLCKVIQVVPAEVQRPNVVTPNNDGVNDLLVFNYLDFYPDNELVLMNRWGNVIYEVKGYDNTWNGIGQSEGTYFFMLTIHETGDKYQGFFQLVR